MSSEAIPTAITPQPGALPWHDGQIQVLRALHFARVASRSELSNDSGLSPQSLTRISQELLTSGYIEEVKRRRTGGMGQPAIELRITPGRILTIGLVLEQDRLTCILSDLSDGILHRAQVVGNFLTAEKTVTAAEKLLAGVLAKAPEKGTLLGLGVSQSGFFFDPAHQRIVALGDPEGWTRMDIGARLQARFGLNVFVENDGRAAAAGHLIHGVGTQFDNYYLVWMTHGIGGGGVTDRKLIRGWSGNAGEMPRGEGMRANVASLADQLDISFTDEDFDRVVEQALSSADPLMIEWLTISAAKLEKVLAGICGVLDPEAVIFSGRMPFAVRQALADRISLPQRSAGEIFAPTATIVVDPSDDCLEVGAAALPIARVFSGPSRRTGRQP
jgi:predicted NBD/HSP70 family sugar kinase